MTETAVTETAITTRNTLTKATPGSFANDIKNNTLATGNDNHILSSRQRQRSTPEPLQCSLESSTLIEADSHGASTASAVDGNPHPLRFSQSHSAKHRHHNIKDEEDAYEEDSVKNDDYGDDSGTSPQEDEEDQILTKDLHEVIGSQSLLSQELTTWDVEFPRADSQTLAHAAHTYRLFSPQTTETTSTTTLTNRSVSCTTTLANGVNMATANDCTSFKSSDTEMEPFIGGKDANVQSSPPRPKKRPLHPSPDRVTCSQESTPLMKDDEEDRHHHRDNDEAHDTLEDESAAFYCFSQDTLELSVAANLGSLLDAIEIVKEQEEEEEAQQQKLWESHFTPAATPNTIINERKVTLLKRKRNALTTVVAKMSDDRKGILHRNDEGTRNGVTKRTTGTPPKRSEGFIAEPLRKKQYTNRVSSIVSPTRRKGAQEPVKNLDVDNDVGNPSSTIGGTKPGLRGDAPTVVRPKYTAPVSSPSSSKSPPHIPLHDVAGQAADLAARTIDDPDLAKQLLLSMALCRVNPRSAPDTVPDRDHVLPDSFYWAKYPPLEAILKSHMEEYYQYSIHKCQSIQQQSFNNRLVRHVRVEAEKQGWRIPHTDKVLRDRIRCYYKTHIQNAKKRLNTMLRNPTKRSNAIHLMEHYSLIQQTLLESKTSIEGDNADIASIDNDDAGSSNGDTVPTSQTS